MAVVTVRFFVGEDREDSLIKLYNKIFQNIDKTTPGIAGWVVKPIEIDDVPIVNVDAATAHAYDTHELYRVAEEVVEQAAAHSRTARASRSTAARSAWCTSTSTPSASRPTACRRWRSPAR